MQPSLLATKIDSVTHSFTYRYSTLYISTDNNNNNNNVHPQTVISLIRVIDLVDSGVCGSSVDERGNSQFCLQNS